MFFVRKRSDSNNVFCAKAKRQQQCFLCESEATATMFFVRKRNANVAAATCLSARCSSTA
ncbi:hypothetical protein [Lysinibacillus sp. RS5]|uniref:hypothetical protein n=1 Tax=unclassified Lysinibacillus TaxID=2636778 RepID=UPI0035BE38A7